MTEEQIKQLAEEALTKIAPEERFPLLLTVAQLLYPEDEGYISFYKELRQFVREATDLLIQEGHGEVVNVQDHLDIAAASKTLEDLIALADEAK